MIALMFYFGIKPSKHLVCTIFILIGIIAALAVGIWLSALTVRYRDFQHVVPFIVQIGLYITPIAYPASFAISKLPDWAKTLYFLNPMAGVVQGFRWAMFGGESPGNFLFISVFFILLLFVSGIGYFNKIQTEMADYI